MVTTVSAGCPAEIEEQFWQHVVDFEQATWVQPFERLLEMGIALPPAEELTDPQLSAKLWEVIEALAFLGMYLEHTDHLSDRELYALLWSEELHEAAVLQPENLDYAYHVDFVGSGSEENMFLYLKYYADEDERTLWAEDWQGESLPEREPTPFDRDRHLPQPQRGEPLPTH